MPTNVAALPDLTHPEPPQGVHYGMFPGEGSPPTTVWTAVRPHNWRPTSTKEVLLELDMRTGEGAARVQGCKRQ